MNDKKEMSCSEMLPVDLEMDNLGNHFKIVNGKYILISNDEYYELIREVFGL